MTEHVRDDLQLRLLADRAVGLGLDADVARSPDQFGVGVAHLVATQATQPDLIDQHPSCQAVIHDPAPLVAAAEHLGGEPRACPLACRSHAGRVAIRHTGRVTKVIQYGRDLPDERELRLCGDIGDGKGDGKRAIELGISNQQNSLVFAETGAKAIAIESDAGRIAKLRGAAAEREVIVQCHEGDLADLGFVTSGSIDLVLANHTLTEVDDLSRLLRQVHRVLKSSRPFVITVPHPFAGVHTSDQYGSKVFPYGTVGRTISNWFIHLARANFRVDQIHELGVSDISPVPTTLILRTVKEGD